MWNKLCSFDARAVVALEGRRRGPGGGHLSRRQRELDRATGRRLEHVRPPGRRRRPVEAVEAPVDQRDGELVGARYSGFYDHRPPYPSNPRLPL